MEKLWNHAKTLKKQLLAFTATTFEGEHLGSEQWTAFLPQNKRVMKALEVHRAYVFSCDLYLEDDTRPWSRPAPWSNAAGCAVQYALKQMQPCDVCFFFDGRSRACRKALEGGLSVALHCRVACTSATLCVIGRTITHAPVN